MLSAGGSNVKRSGGNTGSRSMLLYVVVVFDCTPFGEEGFGTDLVSRVSRRIKERVAVHAHGSSPRRLHIGFHTKDGPGGQPRVLRADHIAGGGNSLKGHRVTAGNNSGLQTVQELRPIGESGRARGSRARRLQVLLRGRRVPPRVRAIADDQDGTCLPE